MAASDPAVQAELARALAMVERPATVAAHASKQVQADAAALEAELTSSKPRPTQGKPRHHRPRARSRLPPVIRAVRNAALGVLATIALAPPWVVSASALWCKGTGSPFNGAVAAMVECAGLVGRQLVVNLWLILAAVVPTVFLAMLLFGLFLTLRWRWRGGRRLARQPGGGVRAVERGVTDNHGHAQWRSMGDALRLFSGPDPRHGGVVVGEAYRVDRTRWPGHGFCRGTGAPGGGAGQRRC